MIPQLGNNLMKNAGSIFFTIMFLIFMGGIIYITASKYNREQERDEKISTYYDRKVCEVEGCKTVSFSCREYCYDLEMGNNKN